MTAAEARILFDYNHWAHERVWTCANTLTDEQFVQDVGYSFGSIRNQLVHVMSVDRRWFARIASQPVMPHLVADQFTTKAEVQERWAQLASENEAIFSSLDDAGWQAGVEVTLAHRGVSLMQPRWQILAHVVNHGTDHRAQTLAMLHQLGAPTVEQDLVYYLWEM